MKTTLNKISAHSRCAYVLDNLLKHLGKTHADDEPLDLLTILESIGLYDTLCCLHAVDEFEREKHLYGVWCARRVEHLSNDPRVKVCNDVSERFANGLATKDELAAARTAIMTAIMTREKTAERTAIAASSCEAARAATWAAWEATLPSARTWAAQNQEFIRMLKEGYPR